MPTVLRKSGFSFKIYTQDHAPAHVHARYQSREAVILLGGENEGVSLRENRGLNSTQLRRATEIADEYQTYLISKWRELYGG